MNIRKARTASAPSLETYSSGLTTLPRLCSSVAVFTQDDALVEQAQHRLVEATRPISRIALVKKRVYSRCMVACSTPPVYLVDGQPVFARRRSTAVSSRAARPP